MKRVIRVAAMLAVTSLAGGCAGLERLRWLGDTPPLAAIENPTTLAGYKPVQMPMPAPQPAIFQPNSLWRTGRAPSSRTSARTRSATFSR